MEKGNGRWKNNLIFEGIFHDFYKFLINFCHLNNQQPEQWIQMKNYLLFYGDGLIPLSIARVNKKKNEKNDEFICSVERWKVQARVSWRKIFKNLYYSLLFSVYFSACLVSLVTTLAHIINVTKAFYWIEHNRLVIFASCIKFPRISTKKSVKFSTF